MTVTAHGQASAIRYTDATVARIAATWANGADPAARVYTIGACR